MTRPVPSVSMPQRMTSVEIFTTFRPIGSIPYGGLHSWSSSCEVIGLRSHLFRLGIHVSCDSHWRARGSAAAVRGAAVLCGWPRAVWLDDRATRAHTGQARMEVSLLTCFSDLSCRLRATVLGRAARAIGDRGGHDGYDSAVHDAVGDHSTANATAERSPGHSALDRNYRSSSAGKSLVEPRWSADRPGGCCGSDHWSD